MSFLEGIAKTSQAKQTAAVSGVQLQSSAYGKAVPIVYGTVRVAPNLIWYGDFVATPHNASGGGGGKGGGGGGGGKNGGGGSSYTYQTAVALGLCEGPVSGIGSVYVNNSVTTIAALGLSQFSGNYAQAAWGYLTSTHPSQAIGYSGITYLAASAYQLGSSAELPNHNFEVKGVYSTSLSSLGVQDADPSLAVADLLTNPHYGAGFPVARLGDLSAYQAYCIANGLWISVAYQTQSQASSLLDDLAKATNSAFVWSQGKLTLVPYGDQSVTANGYTYTAPSAPLYDLGDDDFMPGNGRNDAIQMTRKRASDAVNSMQVECLDRSNYYNPSVIEAKDQAMIELNGLRSSSSAQMHMFADLNAARVSAQLMLQRQHVRNVYQFTLDQRYVLLDPMDIVTISDARLGLDRQWVRITEITENDDGSLAVTAEEYLAGTGSAPLYGYQASLGFSANYNISPGDANAPVLFEPVAELAANLEVWMAVSGGPFWGGCDVYISNDGNSYRNAGRITGGARTGMLTASLPSVAATVSGQTIDTTDTLAVDLSQSGGQLLSGSLSDATSLATLCYVDGEYVAYQNATLVSSNRYNLTWLVRGAYGTQISSHAAGTQFVRIDNAIFEYPFTQDRIGTTIYIKLVSFNIYGGGQQAIADVLPYAYTLKGTAFASGLAAPASLRASYIASVTQLTWDEVQDFRPVMYEIRKGSAWAGAQVLGRVAHPPFSVQGNGTYWVATYSQPVAGLQIYSVPQDIVITGAQIVTNVILSYDEQATGWMGSFSGTAVAIGGHVTTSGGDILVDADYLNTQDILFYGPQGNGIYEIPSSHHIDVGRVVPCNIIISWVSLAQHTYDNILTIPDMLSFSDILDYASSASVNIYPEVALSQDGTTWGEWQKYSAGAYAARKFKARMQLQTLDPTVEAILAGFVFGVDVPDRDDHYVNLAIAATGTTVTFTPDGQPAPVPFNGGPQGAPLTPAVQVTILNAQNGDVVVVSNVSLASCDVRVLNGGTGVARTVNILVQGY